MKTNLITSVAGNRYHQWTDGIPEEAGPDPAIWLQQPSASFLRLAEVHAMAQGQGMTVAVLDTGIDATHPALAGKVQAGWDYIADDPDTREETQNIDDNGDGVVDGAYGHGTFMAGVISLVAPEASIWPARVLNSDGSGNVFLVTQAVLDAADAGADVISISFGTRARIGSKILDEALETVQKRGVLVVAAAGNDASTKKSYPANSDGVVSVTALESTNTTIASFANWGRWVELAAPGENVAGPVPNGEYAWWDGTSVAAPFVSAQAALVKSQTPLAEPTQLTEAMTRTATRLPVKGVAYGALNILGSLQYALDWEQDDKEDGKKEAKEKKAKEKKAKEKEAKKKEAEKKEAEKKKAEKKKAEKAKKAKKKAR